MATFTDDYSKLAIVIPLAAKSDVPGAVKSLRQYAQTEAQST